MIRSELDVLLDKVDDLSLRADLRKQIERLHAKRSFGLVFEHHIPERVRLPQHPVLVGSQVVSRDDDDSPTWEVLAITDGLATLRLLRGPDGAYLGRSEHASGDQERMPIDSLVVISEFGDQMLPGLRHLGSIDRGGDKPYHTVIKGENHHALEALRFTHAGKIDCIYIDPPYNSGARDWKYNNDYVDDADAYRHSKWLAFMERRLKLAKELLNPDDSVLIVTIDEKEYLRLGLLLGQTFHGARLQMVSTATNPKGVVRANEFSRVNEFVFFVMQGNARIAPEGPPGDDGRPIPVNWQPLRRSDIDSARHGATYRPNQFYPIYVNRQTGVIEDVGRPIPREADRSLAPDREACDAVYPVREDGTEIVWGVSDTTLKALLAKGYARAGSHHPEKHQQWGVAYLTSGRVADIESGRASVVGRGTDGSVEAVYGDPSDRWKMPTTQWDRQSHNAQHYGTILLNAFLPGRRFPFPKSLYAVEDAIRFFVKDKPHAVVLDFFAGSGTTAHAVARLNRQDGGRRQSIMITNNEVSVDEAKELRARGLRPGDPEWEALGIFEHITRPRVTAAITGQTPDGEPVKGDYKFTDEFPMAEGFEENVAFLELRYLDADDVDLNHAFEDIAPLLWLRAGARGPIASRLDPSGAPVPYVWTESHGVLFDVDEWRAFVSSRPETAVAAFIVTYSPTTFTGIAAELPGSLDTVRLYDTYLSMYLPHRGRA